MDQSGADQPLVLPLGWERATGEPAALCSFLAFVENHCSRRMRADMEVARVAIDAARATEHAANAERDAARRQHRNVGIPLRHPELAPLFRAADAARAERGRCEHRLSELTQMADQEILAGWRAGKYAVAATPPKDGQRRWLRPDENFEFRREHPHARRGDGLLFSYASWYSAEHRFGGFHAADRVPPSPPRRSYSDAELQAALDAVKVEAAAQRKILDYDALVVAVMARCPGAKREHVRNTVKGGTARGRGRPPKIRRV